MCRQRIRFKLLSVNRNARFEHVVDRAVTVEMRVWCTSAGCRDGELYERLCRVAS